MPQPTAAPVGSTFSPDIMSLPHFLAALIEHSGDKNALIAAVWTPPVNISKNPVLPTSTRTQSLRLEAARQYGLFVPGLSWKVTPLTEHLATLDGDDLYEAFARHILVDLGCLRILEVAEQMVLDGINVTADSLNETLNEQGYTMSVHNTAVNSIRMWLAKANIVGKTRGTAWTVNSAAKAKVIGLTDDEVAAIVGLDDNERAFLRSLCVLDPPGEVQAATVRAHAEMMTGRSLPRGSAPKTFLNGLRDAGFITYTTGSGTASGKTAVLQTTDKFKAEVLAPFLDRTVANLDTVLTAYYKTPPEQTFATLDDADATINDRGTALEAFAVLVMRRLGLRFVGFRARPKDLGYAEVDVVLSGLLGGIATRWQVQCKCSATQVGPDVVQRELGLLPVTKATHVLIIATSGFSGPARKFTQEWMRESSASVYLFGKDEYERLRDDPGSIASIVREQSEAIAAIPRSGLWGR